jgi:lysophospholipase-1
MASAHAPTTPVFWGHGTLDPLVKYDFGQRSATFLTSQLGMSTTSLSQDVSKGLVFNSYQGIGHSTNQQELDDLQAWIKRVIPEI